MGRDAIATEETVEAAVRELTAAGKKVDLPSVKAIIGGGQNGRVSGFMRSAQAKLNAETARLKTIKPSLAKLGARLFEQAILEISADVEADAEQQVRLLEGKAAGEVVEAREAERLALEIADQAERERDSLRKECDGLKESVAVVDGKLAQLTVQLADERQRAAAQLAEECDRATAAIERSEAAKTKALAEAAEARGEIAALRTQLRELQNEFANVRARAKKGGAK